MPLNSWIQLAWPSEIPILELSIKPVFLQIQSFTIICFKKSTGNEIKFGLTKPNLTTVALRPKVTGNSLNRGLNHKSFLVGCWFDFFFFYMQMSKGNRTVIRWNLNKEGEWRICGEVASPMTQCVTSSNFNFLAKFTLGNRKLGMSQTPSPGSPNLESSARTKIHS